MFFKIDKIKNSILFISIFYKEIFYFLLIKKFKKTNIKKLLKMPKTTQPKKTITQTQTNKISK